MTTILKTNILSGINEFKIYLQEKRFLISLTLIEDFLKKEGAYGSWGAFVFVSSLLDLFKPYVVPLF